MSAKCYYKRKDVWPPEDVDRNKYGSCCDEYWELYDEIEKEQLPYFAGKVDDKWYIFDYDRKEQLLSYISPVGSNKINDIIKEFICVINYNNAQYMYIKDIYDILKKYITNLDNSDGDIKTGLHYIIFELIMDQIDYYIGAECGESVYDFPAFTALQVLHSFGVYKLGDHSADKILSDEYLNDLEEISKAGKVPLLPIAMPIYKDLINYFKDNNYFTDKHEAFKKCPYTTTLGKEITEITKIIDKYYSSINKIMYMDKHNELKVTYDKEMDRTPLVDRDHDYYYED